MAYSIIVVTWECADYLAALVGTMNRHLEGSQELVVVDNASSDDARSAATSWKGPLRYVQLESNGGFGHASNVGVREASSDVVVLLNPDTLLVDDSLDGLAQTAAELGGLVGPRLLNPDGSIQPSASGSPVGVWPWVNAFVPGALMPRWMQARTEPWRRERSTRVTWLTGACLAAPQAFLLDLGSFDESLEMYSEDMELGLRAGGATFAPGCARVIHVGDGAARRRYRDFGFGQAARNRRRVVQQYYGERSERVAWYTELLKLELRVRGKTLFRRSADRHRAALAAWKAAR